MWRLKLLVTGLVDWTDTNGDVVTEMYDWADRCSIAGFHGSKSSWLRQQARISYTPVAVFRNET